MAAFVGALVLLPSLLAGSAAECVAPDLRINCPSTPAHPEGGPAGCASRGCCYDSSVPSTPAHPVDFCSVYNHTKPPAPAPPAPSPVVWQAGRDGQLVQVHASGGATLLLQGGGGGARPWLAESAPTACVGGAAPFRGFLNVSAGVASNGTDARLGAYEQFEQRVVAPAALRGTTLRTRFYSDQHTAADASAGATAAAFEFRATLPAGLAAPLLPGAACGGAPILGFPLGGRVLAQPANVAWLTWRGEMARHKYGADVASHDTGAGTAPLVLVGGGGATVLVAPADEFLTTEIVLTGGALSVGPSPSLSAGLPAGYSYAVSAALSSAGGVTRTVMDWGAALQARYRAAAGHSPLAASPLAASPLVANPLNELLSYTTALGEFYDYLDWSNITAEGTPEQVLLAVARSFAAAGLPLGLFMLDIWWVPNDPLGPPRRHCMYDWQPIEEYFPRGLEWLANASGAGIMPYANYLCDNSSYAKAAGGVWAVMDGGAHGNVYPNESHAFWTARFEDARAHFGTARGAFWNDHMAENMDQYELTRSTPGAMRQWMKGQADAALAARTPVMWCMERASQMVQAVEFPAVTTARASGDYHPPSDNWFLGPESLLLRALGKVASKDGINTGAAPNHEGKTEANPLLHTLVATLTRGPVSIGDKLGSTDFSIVAPCCSAAGTILAPGGALVPIDATYDAASPANGLNAAQGVAVWTTSSRVGAASAHGVLAVSLAAPYALRPSELWPPPPPAAALWAFVWGDAGCSGGRSAGACLRAVSEAAPLELRTPAPPKAPTAVLPLQYATVVRELAGGWVLLGEVSKYVPLSPARFTDVALDAASGALVISVRGAPHETTSVLLKKPSSAVLTAVALALDATGAAVATVADGEL
jgi:hypothetical protein